MSENRSVVSNSGNPMDSTIHGILQVKILEKVAFPFLGDLPNSGIEHRSPALQGDSLPSEPQGKPKNTGVGSLPLLQWIFLTQESNQGLLHCRQILYQLSYEGSPKSKSLCHVQLFATPQTIWILQARILEWIPFPFSRGSSQPRDRTQVSHTAGWFFTRWVKNLTSILNWKTQWIKLQTEMRL